MNFWLTSDHHFGHRNIIHYCKRDAVIPGLIGKEPNTRIMDDYMIYMWNQHIYHDDHVLHLGDFSMSPKRRRTEIVKKLSGYIDIIKGNHDPSLKSLKDSGFHSAHNWIEGILFAGGKEYKLLFVHNPAAFINNPKWDYIICGHVHDKWEREGNALNVGVDVNIFQPIGVKEICKKLDIPIATKAEIELQKRGWNPYIPSPMIQFINYSGEKKFHGHIL